MLVGFVEDEGTGDVEAYSVYCVLVVEVGWIIGCHGLSNFVENVGTAELIVGVGIKRFVVFELGLEGATIERVFIGVFVGGVTGLLLFVVFD